MTRTIYIINIVTKKHISQYSANNFNDALDDIERNELSAVDIKFDMDGDVVIFCIPVSGGVYVDSKH